MAFSDTIETGLFLFRLAWEAWYYFIAVLIGMFMILWGIFCNGRGWLLTGAGVATCLTAGWYTWQVLTIHNSG